MEEIGRRIQIWLCKELDLTWDQATSLRQEYLRDYGTTMGGLLAQHDIEIKDFLSFVHAIPIAEYLGPDPALREMLARIPLRKVVYTNATSSHARRVLSTLGVLEQFEEIIGIEEVGLHNKFNQEAYARMLVLLDAAGKECIMVEDSPRNLPPAKALGMITILVRGQQGDTPRDGAENAIDFIVEDVLEVEAVVDRVLAGSEHAPCPDQ